MLDGKDMIIVLKVGLIIKLLNKILPNAILSFKAESIFS